MRVLKAGVCGVIWLVLLASSPWVWAGDDINQTKSVDPTGTVRIHNARGNLEIHGWDRSEIQIDGDLDDLAEAIRFEVEGKLTRIHVDLPTKNVNWGDGSDLDIYIPHSSGLQIDGVSVDIEVEGVTGAIAIRTVSGDIELQGFAGHTQIMTVSGDVEIDEGTGKLSVVTTSGDLDIEVDATDIFVDTMSGDVDLQLGSFDKLAAGSVNGSLKVAGLLNQAGTLDAKTVNADIDIELVEPVNAQIKALALANGEISNSLTDDEPTRSISSQMVLKTVVGDGSAQIKLNTVNGSIEID